MNFVRYDDQLIEMRNKSRVMPRFLQLRIKYMKGSLFESAFQYQRAVGIQENQI